MSSLTLAHFSDLHLDHGGLALRWTDMVSKRLLSELSWRRRRRHHHRSEILERLVADVGAHAPDQIVITGDLTNLSTLAELDRAGQWLQALGDGRRVTVIPGNHDVLTRGDAQRGLTAWRDWMSGDGDDGPAGDPAFPFLRRRGPVALIGVCSAVPTWPTLARGRVGADQRRRLAGLLEAAAGEGYFRIVLVHHPLAAGAAPWRKGLADGGELREILARHGAELILHGHAHRARFDTVAGPLGPIGSLSPPSASAAPARKVEGARWHLIRVASEPGGWRVKVTARSLTPALDGFETAGTFAFQVPAPASPRAASLQ